MISYTFLLPCCDPSYATLLAKHAAMLDPICMPHANTIQCLTDLVAIAEEDTAIWKKRELTHLHA